MTNKEIVQDLLRRIPDDASLHDIARELEFIAAVRQGISDTFQSTIAFKHAARGTLR